MRDMRHPNIGGGSLSKGTQSDGLISDTSTEELTSSSSAGSLKEDETTGKFVAKNSKEICNEARDSTSFIQSKSLQTSLHRMQTPCQLYIRWGVLLSFGALLWVALWVTDIFNPNPFLKEGWLADLAAAKKITLKAGVVKKANPSVWWFHHLLSFAWNSIISVTTLEILMASSCIIIFIYFETHARNKWNEINTKLYYDIRAEQSETDSSSIHLNTLEDSASKEPESKSCSDGSLKFSQGDVKNLITQDKLEGRPKLGVKGTQSLSQEATTPSIGNCISNSLKSCCRINNVKKRSVHFNYIKNGCNLSRRMSCSDGSSGVATSELILNKPNFNLSCMSCTSKSDKKKLNDGQSTFSCAIFNKSTSFKAEKIETWVELSHSDSAEKVMHSFDSELEELFDTRDSPSLPISLKETRQNLQSFNNDNLGCESGEQSKTVIFNFDCNGGIISSSPAFRRFLFNLAKDGVSESYL